MDKFIELADNIRQYDIICLSETWLSETNVYNMKITGYVTHMIYRPKTHHKGKRAFGGMDCFIREDLFFWTRQRHLYLFSLHNSEDKKVNNYGKELIDLCISSRLRILNGRIGMDKEQGTFTCGTPRGSSVVDYSVASILTSSNSSLILMLEKTHSCQTIAPWLQYW